jgi:ribosomal protein S18 acetylase RimI-like enzyme
MASSATVTVRPADAADLDLLARLLITQLREHAIELPESELRAAAEGLFRRPQAGRFLVAVEGEKTIGFAALSFLWTLERGGRAAWLDELYVVPERRGAGIGRKLLHAAMEVAAAAGCRAVDLEIDGEHQRAASLYRREGFRELGRTRWARDIEPSANVVEEARGEREGD